MRVRYGCFGADHPLGKEIVLAWTEGAYISNRRRARKLIPVMYVDTAFALIDDIEEPGSVRDNRILTVG